MVQVIGGNIMAQVAAWWSWLLAGAVISRTGRPYGTEEGALAQSSGRSLFKSSPFRVVRKISRQTPFASAVEITLSSDLRLKTRV